MERWQSSVYCTNFENWRGFAATGGSNPSLSVNKTQRVAYILIIIVFGQCILTNSN